MQESLSASSIEPVIARAGEKFKEYLATAFVACAVISVFGFLFNRATVLSYSIGYNLYGAERVLAGEIPYRDFYTLYPPATLYLNGFLFRLLGVSLYAAMLGVLVFKILTILLIYLSGRQVLPRFWSVAAALISILWLRPNGAFKAVPMQYGAFFLALALFMLLKNEKSRSAAYIFAAGAALGLLTLFKHNIGAYGLAGCLAFFYLASRRIDSHADRGYLRQALVLACGFATVILPVAFYLLAEGAFVPMTRALLFGPGEFLVTRLAFPRSPIVPILFVLILSACAFAAYRTRNRRRLSSLIWIILALGVSLFSIAADEFAVNKLIFYLPLMIFGVALVGFVFNGRLAVRQRREILLALVFAVAAFVELFPRFAREQSVGAMPFVILLLFLLLHASRPAIRKFAGGELQSRAAIAVAIVPFLFIGARLLYGVYFEGGIRFISDTQLQAERGRGVYFPQATARHIDEVTAYIQRRVPADGYIFAQSNSGSPYLFLAARKNPSTAQFWGGVGVTAQDRAATLEEIDRRHVSLIVTNDDVLAAEKYDALKLYIDQNFKTATRFDDILLLER